MSKKSVSQKVCKHTYQITNCCDEAANAPATGGTCTDPDPDTDGTADYGCPSGYTAKNPAVPDGACTDTTTCNTNCCDEAGSYLSFNMAS